MASPQRFAKVSDDEIQRLLDEKDSKNTKRATKSCKIIFEEYLNEKHVGFPQTSEQLADMLKSFYAEVRKKDGSEYTKNSLCAIRFGLKRHFKSALRVDIIKDEQFQDANSIYEAQCVDLKRKGLAKTEHKPPISEEDAKRLYNSGLFNTEAPTTLQNKIFFEVLLFFCRRGRQNLRQLMKNDFIITQNLQGQRCVVKMGDEEAGVMVQNGSPFCPVYSFEKYLSHLNPVNEFLFQRPKSSFCPFSQVWYDNIVIGEHSLGKKMKALSLQANLSFEYTNHSASVTSVAILDKCQLNPRYITSGEHDEAVTSSNLDVLNIVNVKQEPSYEPSQCAVSMVIDRDQVSVSSHEEDATADVPSTTAKNDNMPLLKMIQEAGVFSNFNTALESKKTEHSSRWEAVQNSLRETDKVLRQKEESERLIQEEIDMLNKKLDEVQKDKEQITNKRRSMQDESENLRKKMVCCETLLKNVTKTLDT